MSKTVYEIGIAARIRLDAHSLNNEGTIGNVTEPRTVILADGRKTDGISGEMLKHSHAESLYQLAKDKALDKALHLCPACQTFSPMKADDNPKVTEKEKVNEALNEALTCALCDTHGFLVQKPTLSRKSTIEFGWALALPDQFYRDIHVHARVAAGEKVREKGKVPEQMLYNRPTRSGLYAFISVFQPWRIGLNEIQYTYQLDDPTRKSRYELVLEAYKSMMMRLEGAMTTTRLPHVETVEGAIVISTQTQPVPLISPLNDGYIDQIEKIVSPEKIRKFASLAELLQRLDELKSLLPHKLGVT